MIKLVSAMKKTKDLMDSPLSLADVNQYLDAYKLTGATSVDVSTVIGHPNFQSYTSLWMNACHAKGCSVVLRSAHMNMEGLYGATKFVGPQRVASQFWIDEAVNALKTLPWANGDTEAIYPERTEGIFNDATAFLAISSPDDYANFFISLHNAIKAAIPAITVGLSSNNASELLSGWMPKSLSDTYGMVVVDHYRDDNPTLYDTEIRAIAAKYGKPVYVQEGAVSRVTIPTRANSDIYYAINKKLADDGVLVGYGAWGGWFTNPESVISSSFGLTDAGASLATWWGVSPQPVPQPQPQPIPQPSPDLGQIQAITASAQDILDKSTAISNLSKTIDAAKVILYSNQTSTVKIGNLKKLLPQ